jgi:DNA repair exonuclease SbcCD ATPase subunit
VLGYYRKRIDELQEERLNWLEQVELAKLSQEDFQKNELELERQIQEIAELQKTISDSHMVLFEEKELVIKLRREAEELRAKAGDDRRKIKELLALTNVGEKGITYYKDCRPGSLLN